MHAFEKDNSPHKKSPGQSAGVYHRMVDLTRFPVGETLHQVIHNAASHVKHETNIINNNVPLHVTTIDRVHFTTVCATCTHA